jgi:hypothetical protein
MKKPQKGKVDERAGKNNSNQEIRIRFRLFDAFGFASKGNAKAQK